MNRSPLSCGRLTSGQEASAALNRLDLTVPSDVLHEQAALLGARAFAAQVGDDRAPGLAWKRKNGSPPGLACPQPDDAAAPVDVLEARSLRPYGVEVSNDATT